MAQDIKTRRTEKQIKSEGGFGSYREDTGGGEPIEKGGKWKPHKKEKRVTNQPRTEDGKFTYNSVNGKPLKEISKGADGKSRGTTIPPTLTGGENGIQFKGEKYQKDTKKFDELKKHYEKFDGEFYRKGDEIAFQGHIKISKSDMIESLQEYVDKHFKDYDPSEWDTKKGRHSKAEAQALKVAKKTPKKKGDVFVTKPLTNEIANYYASKTGKKPGETKPTSTVGVDSPAPFPTKEEEQPTENIGANQSATAPAPVSEAPTPAKEEVAQPKYTPEQINYIKNAIMEDEGENFDSEFWTDEQISEFIDKSGGASIFEENQPEGEIVNESKEIAPDPLDYGNLDKLFDKHNGDENAMLEELRKQNIDISNGDLQGVLEAYMQQKTGKDTIQREKEKARKLFGFKD